MILLIVGRLVPAWRSLAWVWRIKVRSIGFLIGALPGIVANLSTSKIGNLSQDVGLDSTVIRRVDWWLGVDLLLGLVVLVERWCLVLLLLITGSC